MRSRLETRGPDRGAPTPRVGLPSCLAPRGSGRHTAIVRRLCFALVSLAAPALGSRAARAGAVAEPAPPPPDPHDFWKDIVDPHGDEVARLVSSVTIGMRYADDALQTDAEWAVEQRMRYFQDAYGVMRYARRLSPENTEVLRLLGRAADELGKTRQAIEALEACAHLTGPERASAEVVGRLGAIYLRLGDRDAAIRWLRLVRGPLTITSAQPFVHLANALAARGDIAGAIDTLANVLPQGMAAYYPQEMTLATFALAVIYDRDEQRSAAFEVLDRMRSALQVQFGPQVQNALVTMRFAPAEDQHYYLALLYEALDEYVEARAEWALYAASGEAPFRARALDHIRAIDTQHRTAPVPPKAPAPPRVPTP